MTTVLLHPTLYGAIQRLSGMALLVFLDYALRRYLLSLCLQLTRIRELSGGVTVEQWNLPPALFFYHCGTTVRIQRTFRVGFSA